MATRRELAAASEELARLDPVMGVLVDRHGPPVFRARVSAPGRYEELARAVTYQQLAGNAAAAIWGRVQALAGGPVLTPERVLALGPEPLRAAGLSGSKAASLLDLATKVRDGDVQLDRIGRLADDDVVAELVQVKGIGPWTAEMFLIFQLHRLDIWPVTDFGVRSGYALAHGLTEMPAAKALVALGAGYRPYRSLAAWYCWRAADTATPS